MENSSLISMLEERGCKLAVRHGKTVAIGLGDGNEAARQIDSGCALHWAGTVYRVAVTGRHRHRFLHNMTTCEFKALEPGMGVFGMVINDSGKLMVQFDAECDHERLVLEVASLDDAQRMVEQLKKYIIADDVKFAEAKACDRLSVIGQGADAVIGALGFDSVPAAEHGWFDATIDGIGCRVRRNCLRLGVPGWDISTEFEGSAKVLASLEQHGAHFVGFDAWEYLRISYGWPISPADFGDENIPLEADRLAATINWDKGCYIGQEVIAMMHYRGRPNKHLGRIEFTSAPSGYEPGLALAAENGKSVGKLGTITESPDGGWVGLAVVKRRYAEDESKFCTPCGAEGTYRRFPKYVVE